MSPYDLLAQVLEVPRETIDETSTRTSLPAWTSVRHLQLIRILEAEYQIQLSYADMRGMRSVADLLRILAEKGVQSDED